MTLNWENVFTITSNIATLFDVVVGSAQGFGDIVDRRSLTAHSVTFQVPTTSIITANIHELFITIDSVYSTGMRSTYITSYQL